MEEIKNVARKQRGETLDMFARIKDAAWESVEDFMEIIVAYRKKSKEEKNDTEWIKIYKDLKKKEGSEYSRADFAVINDVIKNNLGVGISTVERFSKGRPTKRSHFIMLCILCKVTLEDTNKLLKRIGFKELYGRDIDDCIYMYMLATDDSTKSVYKRFDEIKKDVTCRMEESSQIVAVANSTATVNLEEMLYASLSSYETFCNFLCCMKKEFASVNERILTEIRNRVDAKGMDAVDFRNSTFRNKYNKVVEKTASFDRDFLIQLGIHLDYDCIEINEFLEDCGFQTLFSKDMLDSCICYVLEVISLIVNGCYGEEERSMAEKMREKLIIDNINNGGYANVVAEMLEEIFEREEIKKIFGKEIDNIRTKNFLEKIKNK